MCASQGLKAQTTAVRIRTQGLSLPSSLASAGGLAAARPGRALATRIGAGLDCGVYKAPRGHPGDIQAAQPHPSTA